MREAHLPTLTALELARAGRALFGTHWRSELALALGLPNDELVRAVEAGTVVAPAAWRAQLIVLAQDLTLKAMDVTNALLWREESQEANAVPAAALACN